MWRGGESRAWKANPVLVRNLACGAEVAEGIEKVMYGIQMTRTRLNHRKGSWMELAICVHGYNS